MKKLDAFLACAAVACIALVQPAMAGATRSAAALPLIGMDAADNATPDRCGAFGDRDNIRLDDVGNPIRDAAGNLLECDPNAGGAEGAGANGGLIGGLGLAVAAGLAAAASGGGSGSGNGTDSPG